MSNRAKEEKAKSHQEDQHLHRLIHHLLCSLCNYKVSATDSLQASCQFYSKLLHESSKTNDLACNDLVSNCRDLKKHRSVTHTIGLKTIQQLKCTITSVCELTWHHAAYWDLMLWIIIIDLSLDTAHWSAAPWWCKQTPCCFHWKTLKTATDNRTSGSRRERGRSCSLPDVAAADAQCVVCGREHGGTHSLGKGVPDNWIHLLNRAHLHVWVTAEAKTSDSTKDSWTCVITSKKENKLQEYTFL